MADVTGDIGGQPVQLINAATETTLKQLLAAMNAMVAASAKGSKGAKLQAELEKELKRLADTSKDYLKNLKAVNAAEEEKLKLAQKAIEKEKERQKQLEAAAEAMGALYGATTKAALGMTNLISALANTGNSLTAAAQSLNQIPIVGGVLSGVFGAVAGAAEKTYKSFQEAAAVGANFGGSISDMINAATGAGLTFEQFSGIVARTGHDLALLGGTTSEGAKRLAQLGRGIKDTGLGDELAALGYSTEAINEGLAKYSGMLAKTGALQGMNNSQLVDATGQYLKNLDAVSKLTGQSKKELEDARNQRMKDAQFRMIMSKMDAASQENLQMLMDTIPEEHREGMKEIIATGTATSEAGKAALAFLPATARSMMQTNQQIRTTGKLSADQAKSMSIAYQKEATAFSKSGLGETLSNFGDETQKRMALGAMNVAARQGDIGKAMDQQQKDAEERAAKEKDLKEKGLDPASMKAYQEQVAQVSNQFTKLLASSGLLEGMMSVFQGFVGFVSTVVVPVFQFMGDHAAAFGVVLGGLAALVGVTNGILAYHNFVKKMETAGTLKLLAPMAGLFMGMVKLLVPFLPLILVVGAAVYIFKKLGGDLSVVADGLKYMWSGFKSFFTMLKIGFLKVLNTITFGKVGGEALKEAEAELATQQKERAELENKMSTTMKKNREETEKGTEAKKEERQETEKATAAATTGGSKYDFTSPAKLFESSARRASSGAAAAATQPGATAAASVPADMGNYLKTVALLESGGDPNAKAKTSSASGMFQFTEGTWKQMTKEMGKDYSLNDRFDPKKSAEVMAYFSQKQKGQLEKGIGRQASSTDMYMSHFLGAGGATKFLNARSQNANQSAAALDPRAAAANKSIYYDKSGKERSVEEVYQLMAQKVGKAESQVAGGKVPSAVAALGGGGTVAPGGSAVVAATASTPEVKPATTTTASGSGAPAAGGGGGLNEVVASLQTLNMQMGQLIATNRQVLDVSQKQLSVQKSFSGDMVAAAAHG